MGCLLTQLECLHPKWQIQKSLQLRRQMFYSLTYLIMRRNMLVRMMSTSICLCHHQLQQHQSLNLMHNKLNLMKIFLLLKEVKEGKELKEVKEGEEVKEVEEDQLR